jgi:vesicle coat complex subunit
LEEERQMQMGRRMHKIHMICLPKFGFTKKHMSPSRSSQRTESLSTLSSIKWSLRWAGVLSFSMGYSNSHKTLHTKPKALDCVTTLGATTTHKLITKILSFLKITTQLKCSSNSIVVLAEKDVYTNHTFLLGHFDGLDGLEMISSLVYDVS